MTIDRPGFTDPVTEAQSCFRLVLQAMSHPGSIITLGQTVAAPPLAPATASVLLTLVDAEVSLWLDDSLSASWDWLAFHAGVVRATRTERAAFLCATSLPPLESLNAGTDADPEAGATVILQVPALEGGPRRTIYGPGLEAPLTIAPLGLPANFVKQWQRNHDRFPRGVDLLLCAGNAVCALPRSLRIGEG
jgi:alpha-D-ribose 1-methylphosphonate 5-triphosphate synthase subunit PhnH